MTNNEYTPTTEQVYRHQRNGALSYGEMLNCATPPPAWEPVHVLTEAELAATIRQAKAEALREASERLARAAFKVNSIHHLYLPAGDERPRCTCGFVGDARKRTQTEHITNAVLGEFDASRIEAGE